MFLLSDPLFSLFLLFLLLLLVIVIVWLGLSHVKCQFFGAFQFRVAAVGNYFALFASSLQAARALAKRVIETVLMIIYPTQLNTLIYAVCM